DRLAADGLFEHLLVGPESSRTLYRMTEKGRHSLGDLILLPATAAPRPLRQELAVKLLFAGPGRLPELLRLIDHQREAYMRELSLLGVQRRRLPARAVGAVAPPPLCD